MTLKLSTLDDLQCQWQPVRSAPLSDNWDSCLLFRLPCCGKRL